jgi:anaerobic carbon-monoxide dehydrogenase iron sulfur subunit
MNQEYTRLHFRGRKALAVEPKVCSGCRTCEVICSLSHEGQVDLERARLYVKANSFSGSFIPQVCRQCSDAPCFYACPESAIEIEEVNGTVIIDPERCTGCRACQEACPFQVIRFDQEKKKAFKCDFCQGSPECAKWCPVNALGVVEFRGEVPR